MEARCKLPTAAVVIPTCNAGAGFERLLVEIGQQTVQPMYRLVIDSDSQDDTADIAERLGWQVMKIGRKDFSHGGTRQLALEILLQECPSLDIAVYLTQDVRLPQKDSLQKLLAALADRQVAAAYGRQLPHEGASIYAAVDREFNYPPTSRVKSLADRETMGIKAAFLSDSFAAYRVADLREMGGFPPTNICEDMYVAGKMLLSGKKISYVAEAAVHHSHEPRMAEMWRRYRAMGRFQRENPWLGENFGKAGGEGIRLLKYQLQRVGQEKGLLGIAKIIFLDMVRFLAFKL